MTGSPESPDAEMAGLLLACGATVTPGARFADLTTFRLGGPCRLLVDCAGEDALRRTWRILADHGIRPMLIGGGSNLLVCDDGLDRVVVRYSAPEGRLDRADGLVRASAALPLDRLAELSARAGLDGLVSCSGIPGTVGGAIAGNAGAFGEQIGDRLVSVDAMDAGGTVCTLFRDELGFAYRRSSLQGSEWVVLSAAWELDPGDSASLLARRDEILALRSTKHPDWRQIGTAGSFFKNIEPTSRAGRRQAAGWFLEQSGAMDMRVGGAHPYAKHANIIVADPGCRAGDVLELSRRMAAAVKEKFDLVLEREVSCIGFD